MQVLFVTSEGVPFVKTGGLADVSGSLPLALKKEGVEIRVIMPKYKLIPDHFKKKLFLRKKITVSLGWRNLYCGIEELKHNDITYYFIDNEYYFKRDEIYGYGDSLDEAERFAFFNRAVLETLPFLDYKPDILHLNDWQTGLISLFLNTEYKQMDFYQGIKTIFTIHNLKYQGLFPKEILGDLIKYSSSFLNLDGIEYYGRISYLKAGLNYSDYITTVSESYANEIQFPFYGFGLDGVLRKRRENLYGILNGIDITSYNPKTDPDIYVRFDMDNAKQQNKMLLQNYLGLPVNKDIPMISLISRLVSQKGLDLVVHVLDELLDQEIQLVVLGTGEGKYEHIIGETAYRRFNKLAVKFVFDEPLSRKIYASSDLFLMPSLFEPCGISQLIAMQYHAIPIVRETGGLKDSVEPFNEYTGEGTGFSFSNYNAHEMLFTIKKALNVYYDKPTWNRILANIKSKDFSWTQSARKYAELYRRLLQSKGGKLDVYRQGVI